MKQSFGTKAETLEVLSGKAKSFHVLPLYKFTWKEWQTDSFTIVDKIQKSFRNGSVIIRSSASNEDTLHSSNAGKYISVGNVPLNNSAEISNAVKKVFLSYKDKKSIDQVFVQEHLQDIWYSGVAFTADLDTLAPYYIINYDESGDSSIVTSGTNGQLKTYVHFKNSPVPPPFPFLENLIVAFRELENHFSSPYIDIEFAINKKGELFIFQVRPIVKTRKQDLSHLDFQNALQGVYKKVKKLSAPHPNLLGNKTLFGVMPDWNPAEIIGIKPKPLAVSLYKEIITDNIWAYQRDNYGYRNLRSHPLMIMFLGVPYIDVRVDFNSFIPKKLDDSIAEKLVNYYLEKLSRSPAYHDKVEFEIVHSCYYFSLPDKLRELLKFGFNDREISLIKESLLDITNQIIHPKFGYYKNDIERLEYLKIKYEQIVFSGLSIVDKIYWLVEDCKRYGSLPFAGIARSAFIATQILRSLIDAGVITEEEYHLFINSLNTITKSISGDLLKLHQKKINRKEFLEKYGHLRPGTYDILSLRYDENFKNYFSSTPIESKSVEFNFSKKQLLAINRLIKQSGLCLSVQEMISFIKSAIENREYAKYVFTKSISKVLSLTEEFGKKNGLNKANMAYVDLKTIINLYSSLDSRLVRDILREDKNKNKRLYFFTKAVKLPQLIIEPGDTYGFFLPQNEPNFITLKNATASVLLESDFFKKSFENKMIFIKSADPGYDFLFSKNIAGLVTQYGGANSHMSVRCSEHGIPAIIGAGEHYFDQWSRANTIEIDCLNKLVRVIS